MNGSTETGEAFDVHGRRIGIGRDRDGALYFDTGPDLYLYEPAERDKILEAIGRAAMPGQAGAGKSALESAATLTARAFPIYARFAHPDNGYKGDQEQAAKYLVPGRTYLIDHMDVGRSHTTIWLHDFRDVGFNSVLFAAGTEDEWAATQDEPETAPEPGQHACCEHCEHFGDENTDDHREPCPEGCND